MTDQANELRALMRQSSRYCDEAAPSVTAPAMRRMVVFGGKGGVGTTTLAVNLAAKLQRGMGFQPMRKAQHGQDARATVRNIVIDAAGGIATLLSDIEPRYTLSDVLASRKTISETLISCRPGLQIVPGCRHLIPSAETAAWGRVLSQVAALKPSPAWTVIDAGSRPDRNAYNLWQAADVIVVVTTPDTAAVMDAYASIKLLAEPQQSGRIAVLLNQTRPGEGAQVTCREAFSKLAHVCRRFLGLELADAGSVPHDEHVQASARRGEIFSFASPECPAAAQLRQSAQSLMSMQPINFGGLAKTA